MVNEKRRFSCSIFQTQIFHNELQVVFKNARYSIRSKPVEGFSFYSNLSFSILIRFYFRQKLSNFISWMTWEIDLKFDTVNSE